MGMLVGEPRKLCPNWISFRATEFENLYFLYFFTTFLNSIQLLTFLQIGNNFYFFHVFAKFVGWNGPGVPDIGHFSHSEQVHLLIMSYYSF